MNYDYSHLDDYLDDRVIISEDIKKMSREQLDKEIAALEAEARAERDKILTNKTLEKKRA